MDIVERLRKMNPWSDFDWPEVVSSAAAEIEALRRENERLRDKVEGLEADLESAVETAFNRGATEWTRLNYPKLYAALATRPKTGEAGR